MQTAIKSLIAMFTLHHRAWYIDLCSLLSGAMGA